MFCCANIVINHTLQAIQYEKKKSPKLFKRKVWMPFRRIYQHLFVMFGAEEVNGLDAHFCFPQEPRQIMDLFSFPSNYKMHSGVNTSQ